MHALSDVVLAGRLDEGVVDFALDRAIHTLVDLVDEGERSFADFGERHEVHDRRESSFLHRAAELVKRPKGGRRNALLRTGGAH